MKHVLFPVVAKVCIENHITIEALVLKPCAQPHFKFGHNIFPFLTFYNNYIINFIENQNSYKKVIKGTELLLCAFDLPRGSGALVAHLLTLLALNLALEDSAIGNHLIEQGRSLRTVPRA
jgi:hypothetical protein